MLYVNVWVGVSLSVAVTCVTDVWFSAKGIVAVASPPFEVIVGFVFSATTSTKLVPVAVILLSVTFP